jgi:ketosteroid isomerase-like protein
MDDLTEDAVREIERIHSSWIEFEVAGEGRRMLALCADDIEFWPPDAQPVLGLTAEDSTPRQALGSHLWILRKRAGSWLVTLVSWSLWGCTGNRG